MRLKPVITVTEDITLITLQNCPADIRFISNVFEQIARQGINVDMISITPPQGAYTSLSFTINDELLGGILEYTSSLREQAGDVKAIVSSGNCKISILDDEMENEPGVAAAVFAAAATVNTDIRIITTSEVQISLLVTKADVDAALEAIRAVFR